MRKEALLFAGSTLISVYLCGITAAIGLFIFGFAWLVSGGDK